MEGGCMRLPRDVPARGAHERFDLRQPDSRPPSESKFNGKPEAAAGTVHANEGSL